MTTQTEEKITHTPAHIGHELAAMEFLAENQPLGIASYDKRVKELADEIRAGAKTKDEAIEEALDALVKSTFQGFDHLQEQAK
jgi:hypothetical protein